VAGLLPWLVAVGVVLVGVGLGCGRGERPAIVPGRLSWWRWAARRAGRPVSWSWWPCSRT